MKTLIIAEAGINHNRDMNKAVALIDAAKDAGADVVKFQLEVGGDYCPSFEQMRHLYLYCKGWKIRFACTAFDMASLEFLLEHTELDFVKIASKSLNTKLLRAAGKSGKPVILSTGAMGLPDVEHSIEAITGGQYHEQNINLMLLHCVSAYPAPYEQANLLAINTLRKHFLLPVGFSDHSLGIELPVAAVGLGACAIEKHLTLDRALPGPDHVCSLNPEEFKQMVKAIRNVELALGDGEKKPQRCEV